MRLPVCWKLCFGKHNLEKCSKCLNRMKRCKSSKNPTSTRQSMCSYLLYFKCLQAFVSVCLVNDRSLFINNVVPVQHYNVSIWHVRKLISTGCTFDEQSSCNILSFVSLQPMVKKRNLHIEISLFHDWFTKSNHVWCMFVYVYVCVIHLVFLLLTVNAYCLCVIG